METDNEKNLPAENQKKKGGKRKIAVLVISIVLLVAACAGAGVFLWFRMQKNKKNIGIVFSGGGAKGAYEVGVWKALEEAGLSKNVKGISGTSVGALNAVLVSALNADDAEKLWNNEIFFKTILTPDQQVVEKAAEGVGNIISQVSEEGWKSTAIDYAVKAIDYAIQFTGEENTAGLCSRDNLENLIDSKVDVSVLKDKKSPDIYISCVQKKNGGTLHVFSIKEQKDSNVIPIMMASSAIPGVFPTVTLADVKENGTVLPPAEYIDGGTPGFSGNNTNIFPLLKDEKIETIFVVYLKDRSAMDISVAQIEAQNQLLQSYVEAVQELENERAEALELLAEEKQTESTGKHFWDVLFDKGAAELAYQKAKWDLNAEYDAKKKELKNPKKSEEWKALDERYKTDFAFERQEIRDMAELGESSGKKVISIVPSQNLGNFVTGTLNFNKDKLKQLVYLGYADTMEVLKENGFIKIEQK